jgi:hypothetical protein
MSLLMPRPSLLMLTSTPQSTQVYLGLGLGLLAGLAFMAERLVRFLGAAFFRTGFFFAAFFRVVFFLTTFLAAFFLTTFLAAFFLTTFLAAFFLATFLAAFFLATFLAAFFLTLRTAMDSPPLGWFAWLTETSILGVEIMSRFSLGCFVCFVWCEKERPGTGSAGMEAPMAIDRAKGRLMKWVAAVLMLTCLCVPVGHPAAAEGGAGRANSLSGVEGFHIDPLEEGTALKALTSVMRFEQTPCRYVDVVPVSGIMFAFVYDSTEAYEPLRDIYPFDLLGYTAAGFGFPDAHWETGLAPDEVRGLIKREIDSGRPLITSYLAPEAYRGFSIITGYDLDGGTLSVQGGSDTRRAATVPLPEHWDGPTMSAAGWAANPLFVIGEAFRDSLSMYEVRVGMVEEGIALLEGGRVDYGHSEGERPYMPDAGPHLAFYGIPAYEVLVLDVGNRSLTLPGENGPEIDFGLVWRIETTLGLLVQDRRYSTQFTPWLRGGVPPKQTWMMTEIVDNLNKGATEAGRLRDVFWHQVPTQLVRAGEVLRHVEGSTALVFALPPVEGLPDSLRSRGEMVYDTPWGSALVRDTGERRLKAKLMALSLMSRERGSLDLLRQIAGVIESSAESTPNTDSGGDE